MTKDVFLACLDRGGKAANATYAYAVIPDTEPETLKRLVAQPEFTITANTKTCQTVSRENGHFLQAVFHQPGKLTWHDGATVRVSRACCVRLQRKIPGARQLAVFDPQQLGGALEVEWRETRRAPIQKISVAFPTGDQAESTVVTSLTA